MAGGIINALAMKAHFTIRSKLLLFMLAPALVITIVMAYFSHEALNRTYEQQIADLSQEILESASQKLKLYLDKEIDKLGILSRNPMLQAYLRGVQTQLGDKSAVDEAGYFAVMDRRWKDPDESELVNSVLANPAAKVFLDFQTYEKQRYREIFLTDSLGAVIAATNKTSDYYQGDEFWWQAATKNNGSVFLGDIEYDESSQAHSIAIAIPVEDTQHAAIIGVIKTVVDIRAFFMDGAELLVGEKGMVRIFNQSGKIVFDIDQETIDKFENPDILDQVLGRKSGFFKISMDTVEKFAVFLCVDLRRILGQRVITRNLWYFCLFMDAEEALLPLRKTHQIQMLRIGGTVVLLLIGTLYLGRIFSKPLMELLKHTQEISQGNFRTRIHIRTKDEFSELGESFNKMAERLERYFRLTESSERRYKALFDSAKDGIFVLEASTGVVINANQVFCATLNRLPEDVIGKKLPVLIGEISHPQSYQSNMNIFLHDKGLREINLLCGDFNRNSVFDLASGEFELDGQIFIQFMLRDITEKKQIEQIKNNLIRDVAHELRTPAAKLQISLDILFKEVRQCLPESKRLQLLHSIAIKSVQRLRNTVESILDFSRLQEGVVYAEKVPFDLKDLISEVVNDYMDMAHEKGFLLSSTVPDQAVTVLGDRRLLKMAISNLLSNAIKFTVSGEVSVRIAKENGLVSVVIKDTGIGIAPEHLRQVFDRFYQVSPSMPGCGIGLAIANEIAKLHSGRISAQSEGIGCGSIFKLELLPA